MIDRDLAELYGVETKVLNQAVKRNIERFPESFRFQLTELEKEELVTNCDRFDGLKHSSSNPFVFTEQGVAMLSAVLKSDTARTRIVIIDNYVDDTVLVQLSKRKPGGAVDIYDGQISKQLRLDVEKHNEQYPG